LTSRMFEDETLRGNPGEYPLTAENLFRVGLALGNLLIADRGIDKPILSIDKPDFVTLAVSVGFMNAGGFVRVRGEADVHLVCKRSNLWEVKIEGLFPDDFRKLEIILFGRTPIPKKKGEEIGRIETWTREMKL